MKEKRYAPQIIMINAPDRKCSADSNCDRDMQIKKLMTLWQVFYGIKVLRLLVSDNDVQLSSESKVALVSSVLQKHKCHLAIFWYQNQW